MLQSKARTFTCRKCSRPSRRRASRWYGCFCCEAGMQICKGTCAAEGTHCIWSRSEGGEGCPSLNNKNCMEIHLQVLTNKRSQLIISWLSPVKSDFCCIDKLTSDFLDFNYVGWAFHLGLYI